MLVITKSFTKLQAGGAVEEREKEKFNRMLNNYNSLYKDADSQFVLSRSSDEEDSRS